MKTPSANSLCQASAQTDQKGPAQAGQMAHQQAMPSASLDALTALAERQWHRHGQENAIDGLRLTRATEPSGTMRAIYPTSFCVVLQGSKLSELADTRFHYRQGQCLLASVNVPVNSRIMEASPDCPYVAFSVALDPEMVAELLLHAPASALATAPRQAPCPPLAERSSALSTAALPTDLIDPLLRLLQLLDQPQDLAVLEPLLRREICWRLLRSPMGAALQQIGMEDSDTARIGRVTAWMRSHYQQGFKVADLAAMASMSPASFHRHFKAITQFTPVQFQKQIRLQAARRLLLTDHEVASVGYRVGYESPSQFSRDYHKVFGAPPGRDKAKLRSSLVLESID
jgi:AraC-like DNA-binding protein